VVVMNAPAHPLKAERSVTFKAWRNSRPGEDSARLANAATIEEAVAAVTPAVMHRTKDMVASILRIDAGRGAKTLFVFGFKRSTKHFNYEPKWAGGVKIGSKRIGRIEPVLLHEMEVRAFEPVEPFRVTRDTTHAEIVGIDPQLVEQQ
jgi:hypothetical protein